MHKYATKYIALSAASHSHETCTMITTMTAKKFPRVFLVYL